MIPMVDRVISAVILAGGRGLRLGGTSKADLDVSGRLLDRVVEGLRPHVNGSIVVVAPDTVNVPDDVVRTMEEPAGGGPLAGIGVGVDALALTGDHSGAAGDEDGLVLVFSVDSPAAPLLAPRLLRRLEAAPQAEGTLIVGGEPTPFRQYLQAAYRIGPLRRALADSASAGGLHGRSVRSALCGLDLVEEHAGAEECRDIDTVQDLAWWRGHL